MKGSSLFISLRSKKSSGLKPESSPAILTLRFCASNLVMYPMPLLPFEIESQYSETEFPLGARTPSPVITTRRLFTFFI